MCLYLISPPTIVSKMLAFSCHLVDLGAGAEADGWSDLPPTETVACSGMARAAEWLHREVRYVHPVVDAVG